MPSRELLQRGRGRSASPIRALVALLITALITTGLVGTSPITAHADADDFAEITVPAPSSHYNGVPVYESGNTFTGALNYGMMTPGSSTVMTLPEGFTWPGPDGAVAVPAGNEAIASITKAGQEITFTWADPWPAGIDQGTFAFDVTIDAVDSSEVREVEWRLNGIGGGSGEIIIREPGDEFASVSPGFDKTAGWVDFGNMNPDPITVTDGVVSVSDAAFDVDLPYTLEYRTTEARPGLTITDTLPSEFVLVADSGTTSLTTWDADGLNREVTSGTFPVAAGKTFTHTVDLTANSVLRLNYSVRLDISQRAEILAALQASYDAIIDGGEGGDWGLWSVNTASTNDSNPDREVGRWIQGGWERGPWRPDLNVFSKGVDVNEVFTTWSDDEDRTIDPVSVTYTLNANLTQWGDNYDDVVLGNDVVIADALPPHAEWLTAEADFLTLTNLTSNTAVALTEVTLADGDDPVSTLRAAGAGSYILDGQNLYINVGKEPNNYRALARAQITNVADPIWTHQFGNYAEGREVTNPATFHWDGDEQRRDAKTWIKQYIDPDAIDWPEKFNKTGPGRELTTTVGQSVDVQFNFNIAPGVGDVTKSVLTDYVDHEVFLVNEANLSEITAALAGNVGGVALSGDDFDVVLNPEGNLEIRLSETGAAKVTDPMAAYNLRVTLKTVVFERKSSLELNNAADYHGTDTELTWVSETTSRATTFGNELEVNKTVYNAATDRFIPNLRVEVEDGELVADEFVYRIRLHPHGTFSNIVRPITDVLPEEVEFLGFVDSPDGVPNPGPNFTIPGSSIQASFADGALTIPRGALNAGVPLDLMFKVRVTDFTEDVGIRNIVGPSVATIVPTNGYPLDVNKVDADDNEVLITDTGARFEVRDAATGDVVADDVYVVDGKLVTPGENGAHKALLVEEPGTYQIRELQAPDGYFTLPADTVFTVTVNQDGDSRPVHIDNDPKYYAIGDYTWIDADRNGLQDDSEVLPGVGVELLDGNGEVIATTTTNGEGRYLFDNLRAGDYQVRFTLTEQQAAVYKFTGLDAGDDAADSDADPATGTTARFTLNDETPGLTTEYTDQEFTAPMGIDPTWDAGVVLKTYAVGDYVWIDANNDGVQGEDEEPLPGVTVELLDGNGDVVASTTTDADGRYVFDELPGGDYQVRFTLTEEQAAQYYFTAQDSGDDDAADSDANPATGTTGVFTLNDSTPGLTVDYTDQTFTATQGIDPTWDAGVVSKTYAVGDYVWIDANRDGLQGDDELPLAGVTVELLQGGAVVDSMPTDDEGRYLFDNLPAGDYQVRFTLTEDQSSVYTFTAPNAGDDDAADSDAGLASGTTQQFRLDDSNAALTTTYDRTLGASQGVDPTWDAGVVLKTYAVGDVVWVDENRDGLQGDSEVLTGVTVELLDSAGDVVATTTTDENGRYLFDNLLPGDYQVKFTLTDEQAALYNFTTPGVGEDGAADSDADPATGTTAVFTLDDSNAALTKSYTDQTVGATEGIDPTWDAGVVRKTYAVGDVVWVDENGDGVQGDSEVLTGVTVELLDSDGDVVATTATDENGRYLFDNLLSGDYQVRFILTDEQAALYNFTTPNAGDDAADSDADPATGTTAVFTLDDSNAALTKDYTDQSVQASEGIDPTWDAGVVRKTYAVGDVVWVDENGDGVQGDSEVLTGVTVELLDSDGDVVATTTTDEFGRYLFDNLLSGDYQVKFTLTDEQAALYNFTAPNVGDDDAADSDADPATGTTAPFTLDDNSVGLTKEYEDQEFSASEGIDPTWDAGVVRKTYAVGDIVWVDGNRDGLQGEDEVLEGVTVELLDGEGNVLATTTTDENGRYLFDNLLAGDYQVRFTLTDEQAALYNFTTLNAGDDDAADSDADPVTGTTAVFTLDDSNAALTKDYTDQSVEASEGIDPTWDAGVVRKTYAVGDVVWVDVNGNGLQDDDEGPLPGVKVELFDSEGNLLASTTTDEQGRYLFDDLVSGEYQVRFTLTDEQKELYEFTNRNAGDGSIDSDADADGWTIRFTLDDTNPALTKDYDQEFNASEGVDPTWDAGVVLKPVPEPTPSPTPTEDPGDVSDGSDDEKPKPGLPNSGADLGAMGLAGVIAALLVVGAGLTFARARRVS